MRETRGPRRVAEHRRIVRQAKRRTSGSTIWIRPPRAVAGQPEKRIGRIAEFGSWWGERGESALEILAKRCRSSARFCFLFLLVGWMNGFISLVRACGSRHCGASHVLRPANQFLRRHVRDAKVVADKAGVGKLHNFRLPSKRFAFTPMKTAACLHSHSESIEGASNALRCHFLSRHRALSSALRLRPTPGSLQPCSLWQVFVELSVFVTRW